MIQISAIYFKPTHLNIIIHITFEDLEEQKKIKLKEIHFFKNRIDATDFIGQKNLELIEDTHTIPRNNIQSLIDLINNYLSEGKINLFDKISELGIQLDIQEKFPTRFSQDVVRSLINLKPGEITTYSKIGDEIGSKAYRAIGNVCKSNPIPLVIPCHRVLRKNGEIGGFMGKSDKTWETNLKKQLLKIEGYQI
ncbi:Methylated-DNA--protein-cysteine methyltransferase [subsurface metagenome]